MSLTGNLGGRDRVVVVARIDPGRRLPIERFFVSPITGGLGWEKVGTEGREWAYLIKQENRGNGATAKPACKY